jgi:prevent-host-death family protein
VKSVDIQEARTHLSRLLEEAVGGVDIVITKAGRPYVRLVPCLPDSSPRVLGGWEGKVTIAEDFDETPAELIAAFEGETSTASRSRRRT